MTAVINPHYIKAYGKLGLNEHDLLITGFDDKNEFIIGKDFFSPLRKFGRCEIPYCEYLEAFSKRNIKYNIRFFKKRDVISQPVQENLIEVLRDALYNYLDESISIENPYYPLVCHVKNEGLSVFMEPAEVWTGIGIYDGLIKNIHHTYFRDWVLFIDIHRLICDALLLVIPNCEALINFEKIIKNLQVLLIWRMKYQVTTHSKELSSMVDRLWNLKEKEKGCIKALLYQLET